MEGFSLKKAKTAQCPTLLTDRLHLSMRQLNKVLQLLGLTLFCLDYSLFYKTRTLSEQIHLQHL